MSNKIAYLTLKDRSGFVIYDHVTFEPLSRLGLTVQEIPWQEKGVDWSQFAAVVIRSTWDYQKHVDEFLDVLRSIEQSGTRLFNSLNVVRWNIQKTYLRDLQSAGITIVPTVWFESLGDATAIAKLFDECAAERIVIKPIVGANADRTFRLTRNAARDLARDLIADYCDRPGMAQPFIPGIVEPGEYSLFHFGGRFSHAVVKRPGAGDFRVQEEHGGIIQAISPTIELLSAAEKVIAALPHRVLFSRVDLLRLPDDSLALMEIELIEPSLYFPFAPEAADRFARAIHDAIQQH